MNIKERIKKEIKIQKQFEGDACQDRLLLDFLKVVKLQSQWDAFINVKHHHYGVLSYQTHRFYYPKEELLNLISCFQEVTNE
jgi:hypothetical protein